MSLAFDKIMAGLEDAIAYGRGDKSRGVERVVRPVNIKALRQRLELSQTQFARVFNVSVGTLRNWEQGVRRPQGPARVLLHVIEREPEAVMRALYS